MTLEKIAAWAITEPDSGSDAFGGMKTHVKRDGADYGDGDPDRTAIDTVAERS